MTDEELQRYLRLGIESDVHAKAKALQHAIKHLENTFTQAAGLFHPTRFTTPCEGVRIAITDFLEAMAKLEATGDARGSVDSEGVQGSEAGGAVPVHRDREQLAEAPAPDDAGRGDAVAAPG